MGAFACCKYWGRNAIIWGRNVTSVGTGLLSLCSLRTYSQGVTRSFPNPQSGSFSQFSFLCCKKSVQAAQGIPPGG